MELKVYDGEYFDRGAKRFVIFAFIILLVAVLSILGNNIIGGVFVLIAAAAYLYYLNKTNKIIKMITGKKALQVGKLTLPWDDLKGFVLEYHTEKKKIHNIVLINNKKEAQIFTIKDSEKNLEGFINELNGYLTMLEKYDQSTFERIIRKLKL